MEAKRNQKIKDQEEMDEVDRIKKRKQKNDEDLNKSETYSSDTDSEIVFMDPKAMEL
eukprot:CAMPEP_0205806762 /NCGR_PEP_ID=MMETSP0205-20121125/10400_1 /ASSEMBLY_ACC=CAM_ASM_000278 /TAXON_ID=36767 /ORGANISM="Euplotes focardii, Strain TN1" /LENGTH=56 /DNA_ID=CAMNT_0053080133 /DNA_START=216 /DNA_END=383 /DNA_ORIENTATION=+